MKLALLLCLSLLFSMLHAAAMPVRHISDVPVTMQAEAAMTHDMSAHCAKWMQDDQTISNCCLGVAIQSAPLPTVVSIAPQGLYLPLSPRPVRYAPDFIFRPPKFRPA